MRPLFTAIATTWTSAVPPDRALRSVLLTALFGAGSGEALCARVAEDLPFRRFLGMTTDEELNPIALAAAQDRLLRNVVARRFVGDIVAAARAAGVVSDDGGQMDVGLVTTWTTAT